MTTQGHRAASVVIPTTLRAHLWAAIESARGQRDVPAPEVVVVVDRDPSAVDAATRHRLAAAADVVRYSGGGQGGSHCRNLGVAAASTGYVAFLDDDDRWLPAKTAVQLDAIAGQDRPLAACQAVQRRAADLAAEAGAVRHAGEPPVPRVVCRADQPVDEYLFRARRPARSRASLFTSTLLMPTQLAREVGWRRLPRHQDWDFVIRAQRGHAARIVQVPEPLALIAVGSADSISASADWRASLDWATRWRGEWTPRTYADFVAGQPLRYALTARSWSGARDCVRSIRAAGAVPGIGPAMIAATGLLGRRAIERAMVA